MNPPFTTNILCEYCGKKDIRPLQPVITCPKLIFSLVVPVKSAIMTYCSTPGFMLHKIFANIINRNYLTEFLSAILRTQKHVFSTVLLVYFFADINLIVILRFSWEIILESNQNNRPISFIRADMAYNLPSNDILI